MNLTRNFSFASRDDYYGGIFCPKDGGPFFGNWELTVHPYGKEGQLWSCVEYSGFKIPGKVGETNPLTGDKIVSNINDMFPHSESTLKEIEVWEIIYND